MLIENISKKDIKIGLKAMNWEDAIEKSSQVLLDKGCIDSKYIQAMIDVVKEKGPYIVIGKHIALAHARPECGVNEFGLSFSLLDTPVKFGSDEFDPVKLIITLAATDANSHLEVLSELAEVLMDQERIDILLNAKTNEAFYDELIK